MLFQSPPQNEQQNDEDLMIENNPIMPMEIDVQMDASSDVTDSIYSVSNNEPSGTEEGNTSDEDPEQKYPERCINQHEYLGPFDTITEAVIFSKFLSADCHFSFTQLERVWSFLEFLNVSATVPSLNRITQR